MAEERKLSYFFLGLGIGVGIGILFAPKSGPETREVIRNKTDEGKEYLKKRSGELRESAGTVIERGKTVVERQKETLASAVQAGKRAYREAVDETAPETGTKSET